MARSHMQLTPWTPRLLAWQAWYLATSSVDSAWQAWHLDAVDAAAVCVAGVVLGDIERRFCVGRRGTWRHVRAFCVAGVDLFFVSRPYVSLAGTSAVALALLHRL